MGLFGPTSGGGGGGGSQDSAIVVTATDARILVTSSPNGSVFLLNTNGTTAIADPGLSWVGTRTFVNVSSNAIPLTRENASPYVTLKVGEVITLSFNGTSFTGDSTAINHENVRWTGVSSIPEATTTNRGLLSAQDKLRLGTIVNAASYSINTWTKTSGVLTIVTNPSHGFSVGDNVFLKNTGGSDSTLVVDQVLSSNSFRGVVGGANASGNGGAAVRTGFLTGVDKAKLDDLSNVNVKPDWNALPGQPDEILNKPTIPAAPVNANWNATSGLAEILNKPTIPAAPVNADWNATSGLAQILNRPGNGASFNISTWSGDGTTTTINATGHTFLVGQPVTFRNTGSTLLDGLSDVPVLSASTNSFTIASTLNGSGFGGFVARRGLISPVQMNQLQTAQQAARSVSISSWTANGTTATISATNHNFFTNDSIFITGAGSIDGTYTITATTADQFTFATSVNATGTGGVAVRAGRMSNADKVTLDGIRRNVFGPMIILRFANWGRGQTGYGPGNPPTGMSTLTPTSGNVVENFNPDIYHPRLFNGGQFFGIGRQYRLICAVRCDQIAFDGVHCQLRYFNGTTSQIIPGLMDFGGGNDGIAIKSYFATSDTLTAVDEWWTFVPFFGAFNGSNFARIQDCVVVAYLV
jgi:hypothetical protein